MHDLQKLAYALWGFGALFGLVGAVFLAWRVLFVARASRAVGEITGVEGNSGDFPIVSFNAAGGAVAGGRVVTFRSDVSMGSPRVGAKVPVAYDPREPTKAIIATVGYLWGIGLLLLVFAAALALAGVASWRAAAHATPVTNSVEPE